MADMQELAAKLNECAAKRDFEGAMKIIRANQAEIAKNLKPDAIAAALKKTTDDRILLARHSERLVFYTLLYFSRGDAASCAACRPILDPFIADARTLAPFYCETVRRAMDWYEGRVLI